MGASSSRAEPSSSGSKHIFSSSSPVQFSANLVEALQSSSETDSSREKSLELQIQARVAEELERLRAREQQTLAEIEKRLADVKDDSDSDFTAARPPPGSSALNLDAPRVPFAGGPDSAPPPPQLVQNRDVTRDSVMGEIEQLRRRLQGRRRLNEVGEEVEKARQDVVACLRLNDRRPLDCWEEVELFKREVARLEQAFVDRVVG